MLALAHAHSYWRACSGLETGAEKIKTEHERTLFGGIANSPYDACYHQFCDSIDNIAKEALEINVPAAAYAVEFLGTHPQLNTFLFRDGPAAVSLDAEVSADTVMAHLQNLQQIADENGGNRDITGPGLAATDRNFPLTCTSLASGLLLWDLPTFHTYKPFGLFAINRVPCNP